MPTADFYCTVGTNVPNAGTSWTNPGNIAHPTNFATIFGLDAQDSGIYVTLDGLVVSGSNLAKVDVWPLSPTEDTYSIPGLSLEDMKGNADFGMFIATVDSLLTTSDYLYASNVDFSSIPDGSTIDSVDFKFTKLADNDSIVGARNAYFTVTWTEPAPLEPANMQSHKVFGAGVTHTVPASGADQKHYLRFKSLTVLGTGNVTMTVTNSVEGGYSGVFNSAVGHYKGPFQFRPRDQVAFVVDSGTTLLLEGYQVGG